MIIYLCMELRPKSDFFLCLLLLPQVLEKQSVPCDITLFESVTLQSVEMTVIHSYCQRPAEDLTGGRWCIWHEHNSNMYVCGRLHLNAYIKSVERGEGKPIHMWGFLRLLLFLITTEAVHSSYLSLSVRKGLYILQRGMYSLFIGRYFPFMIQPLRDNWLTFFLILTTSCCWWDMEGFSWV